MKPILFFLSLFVLTACKQTKQTQIKDTVAADNKDETQSYPPALQMVLEAHGGLQGWKAQKTLRFQLAGGHGDEKHTIDLRSRRDRIDGPHYSLGFDGQDVWIADSTKLFEGNPVFYHNLMFYFYAMPFVFADKGIIYGDAEPLAYNGKEYPGIRIKYRGGVGSSPKDEYYLYYDPETHIMTWLGYTVTYFSDAPSDNLHWLRYDEWTEVNSLLLPSKITWYNYDGHTIKDARETVSFDAISLSGSAIEEGFYDGPANATVVEK